MYYSRSQALTCISSSEMVNAAFCTYLENPKTLQSLMQCSWTAWEYIKGCFRCVIGIIRMANIDG